MLKKSMLQQVKDLVDDNLQLDVYSKGDEKFEAHQQISISPYCSFHKSYCDIYCEVSFHSFIRNKPYHITPPTATEMEMCMCSIPHCMYRASKKEAADTELTYSLTEYFCI